ncbi:response regulator [Paracoccus tibetensis]|uniref:Two-component system, chemotaxis family, response regulator CheY n=1 Tax=Paracoccus tibetensis TaxID=336292 RepID=A0A1G5J0P7_9RHOB|nr:response regulator [Paracoccus tibetensis]SCY81530.1 two-component system, chemotaxis family, response regulator CheY [Paracoccus tibetensis]
MSARILAVDDSPTIRALVGRALRTAGYEVFLASDGVEGVGSLKDVEPELIITDINMPRLDGFGLIETVRASADYGSVPILVLTTESGADLKARARAAGATGWIVKPFDDAQLVSVIARVLGK